MNVFFNPTAQSKPSTRIEGTATIASNTPLFSVSSSSSSSSAGSSSSSSGSSFSCVA